MARRRIRPSAQTASVRQGVQGQEPDQAFPDEVSAEGAAGLQDTLGNAAVASMVSGWTASGGGGDSSLENTSSDPASDRPLLLLRAGCRDGPRQASIDGCWFVGNQVAGGGALLGADTRRPDVFSRVQVRDSAFVANQAAALLAPALTETLVVEHTLIYQPGTELLLSVRYPKTGAQLTGSTLAFAGGLAWYATSAELPLERFQPVELRDSVLHVPGPEALGGAQQLGSTRIVAFEEHQELATKAAALARQGGTPGVLKL